MNYKIKGLEVEITDEQLDELIKERENKGKMWKPTCFDLYWMVSSGGCLNKIGWANNLGDKYRWESVISTSSPLIL